MGAGINLFNLIVAILGAKVQAIFRFYCIFLTGEKSAKYRSLCEMAVD
jgi:hypothetical protein